MDLPESVAAIGGRLGAAAEFAPDPELFCGADVFAAERERIFARPWMAVDHHTRLGEDGSWFRFEAATRSILVTRVDNGRLHALRNLCIHAGYPVCDAQDGAGERLVCPYHGWEFALDGRLVEPELSARIDPARLRLASYPVCVRDGLIFVDPSAAAGSPEAGARSPQTGAIPDWLAEGGPTRRARYSTNWNWKLALQFLKSSPHLLLDGSDEGGWIDFGPLSLMRVEARQAALLRVIPKSAERTDLELIQMAPRNTRCESPPADGGDRLAEGLRQAGDAQTTELDREFFSWYWSLMSPN